MPPSACTVPQCNEAGRDQLHSLPSSRQLLRGRTCNPPSGWRAAKPCRCTQWWSVPDLPGGNPQLTGQSASSIWLTLKRLRLEEIHNVRGMALKCIATALSAIPNSTSVSSCRCRTGLSCELDAREGRMSVQSQLHPGAQLQRHLSCSAAALVSVVRQLDLVDRPELPKTSQMQMLLTIAARSGREQGVDSHMPDIAGTVAAALHNTAHLILAHSTATGEHLSTVR